MMRMSEGSPMKMPAQQDEEKEKGVEISGLQAKCQKHGYPFGDSPGHLLSGRAGDEFMSFAGGKPTVAPVCHSDSSNARGHYNSYYVPCKFQYHTEPHTSGKSFRLGLHKMSTVCSDDNVFQEHTSDGPVPMEPFYDYVRAWPDECVGDFRRCYSMSDTKIFLKHFCLRQWELPPAVTHVSVTCEEDKQEASKHTNDFNHAAEMKKHLDQERRHHQEKLMVLVFIVFLLCSCCWAGICAGYTLVVAPYLKSLKKSKSDPDLKSLVGEEGNADDK